MDVFDVEFWIDSGKVVDRPEKPDGALLSDRQLLHTQDLIKIETGPRGTRAHWITFGRNWSSLVYLSDFIMTCAAPVTLRYFNAGWFEETLSTTEAARDRIQAIMSKSDIRFAQRTYTESYDPVSHEMPEKLRQAYESQQTPDDWSVICAIDTEREIVNVEHVGKDSALGKIWGVSPVSYPCQTGHSYDRVVSRSYFTAIQQGRPLYDHVLAAMVRPDGEVSWLGYRRLIFPETKVVNGFGRVRVVSELGPVDIKLL